MCGRIMTFFTDKGEGTKWDLDYGKLIIIGLCICMSAHFESHEKGYT